VEGGEVKIYRGDLLMMICAKDNGMSWVYLDNLLKYIIAPEQYQGVEPQLEEANLSVNLLTAPT
jgi:hypothetical protein